MKLVDEQDHAFGISDLVNDRLDAFLELSPVFRACHHERQVQRENLFIVKNLRNISRGDCLRQPFDDRGFSHARLSDQNRIVFRAAAENLGDAFDFLLTADHGVELPLLRHFGQVAPERIQRIERLLLSVLLGLLRS